MKKFILLSLLALLGAAPIPAFARELSRAECVTRIETCEAILQEFQADPALAIPASILQKAKAIIVVNQFKAGFFLGVKDGYGFIIVKQASGRWSLPVLISAGEASFGLQIGAKSVETIMIVTDEQTPRLIFNERFNVGVDAKAVIGPKAAEAEHLDHQLINAPILITRKPRASTPVPPSRPATSRATTARTSCSTTRSRRCPNSSTASGSSPSPRSSRS